MKIWVEVHHDLLRHVPEKIGIMLIGCRCRPFARRRLSRDDGEMVVAERFLRQLKQLLFDKPAIDMADFGRGFPVGAALARSEPLSRRIRMVDELREWDWAYGKGKGGEYAARHAEGGASRRGPVEQDRAGLSHLLDDGGGGADLLDRLGQWLGNNQAAGRAFDGDVENRLGGRRRIDNDRASSTLLEILDDRR
jgi:hypothetical protein